MKYCLLILNHNVNGFLHKNFYRSNFTNYEIHSFTTHLAIHLPTFAFPSSMMAKCTPGRTYYLNADFQLKSVLLGVSLPAMIWLNIALLDAGFVVPYFPSVWFPTKIRQAFWNKCTMRFLLPTDYAWFIVDINYCDFSTYLFVLQLITRKLYFANIFR